MLELLKQLLQTDQTAPDAAAPSGLHPREALQASAPADERPPNWVDRAQALVDLVGVADPTGLVDLSNAGVSLLRGTFSEDLRQRRRHFQDAGIRMVSAVPYIGDTAKLARMRRYARELSLTRATERPALPTAEERYFRGSMEYRRQQRIDPRSAFYDKQEAADERLRAHGYEDSDMRQRRRQRRKSEFLHQSFLRKPEQDVRGRIDPILRAQAEFRARQEEVNAHRAKREKSAQEARDQKLKEEVNALIEHLKRTNHGFKGFVATMLALPPVAHKFGAIYQDARREISLFSGSTQGRMAVLDMQRIMLNLRTGQNTAWSGNLALDELRRFNEAFQPQRELFQQFKDIASFTSFRAGRIVASVENVLGRFVRELAEKHLPLKTMQTGGSRLMELIEQIAAHTPFLKAILDEMKRQDQVQASPEGGPLAEFVGMLRHEHRMNQFQWGERQPLPPIR